MRGDSPILLVEDDRIDAMTVSRAMKELNVKNRLDVVSNGEEALKYLNEKGRESPALILLDINMPKMNGIEFMRAVKDNPQLKRIPIVVLTTSREEQDRMQCFDLGVSGYMVKPVDYMQFVETMRVIDVYWTISERG
ncbi:MAG: response regulator [Chlorobiales bacterium]|jgi:CheY-like chemotaxis protein|nr:response regulator [Chlorobiales bacterium]